MSIRAKFLTLVMRYTVKRLLENISTDDPGKFRDDIGAAARFAPRLPNEATVVAVEANGVPCEWISYGEPQRDQVHLYLHGGGYVLGLAAEHRELAWRLARQAAIRVFMVDYRLAPEYPFPAALEDATNSYRWLLEQGHDPENISVGGDSAGGGLCMALLINLRNQGLPLPNAALLLSPWVDLSCSGDSAGRNAVIDPILSPATLDKFARFYVGDRDMRAPLVSPVFADLKGLPPMLVHVGSTEVLLSDAERLVDRVNIVGGDAHLNVWPDMPHVFQLLANRIPEAKTAITELSEFLKSHMPVSAEVE